VFLSTGLCLSGVFCVQAGRRLAVRVNARGQKLEYLWCDGQEGKESKVRPCSCSSSFLCSHWQHGDVTAAISALCWAQGQLGE
jgi:hypothetical protein